MIEQFIKSYEMPNGHLDMTKRAKADLDAALAEGYYILDTVAVGPTLVIVYQRGHHAQDVTVHHDIPAPMTTPLTLKGGK